MRFFEFLILGVYGVTSLRYGRRDKVRGVLGFLFCFLAFFLSVALHGRDGDGW